VIKAIFPYSARLSVLYLNFIQVCCYGIPQLVEHDDDIFHEGRLHVQGLGGFGVYNYYWSSSQNNSIFAWAMFFNGGNVSYHGKNNYISGNQVREVRAF